MIQEQGLDAVRRVGSVETVDPPLLVCLVEIIPGRVVLRPILHAIIKVLHLAEPGLLAIEHAEGHRRCECDWIACDAHVLLNFQHRVEGAAKCFAQHRSRGNLEVRLVQQDQRLERRVVRAVVDREAIGDVHGVRLVNHIVAIPLVGHAIALHLEVREVAHAHDDAEPLLQGRVQEGAVAASGIVAVHAQRVRAHVLHHLHVGPAPIRPQLARDVGHKVIIQQRPDLLERGGPVGDAFHCKPGVAERRLGIPRVLRHARHRARFWVDEVDVRLKFLDARSVGAQLGVPLGVPENAVVPGPRDGLVAIRAMRRGLALDRGRPARPRAFRRALRVHGELELLERGGQGDPWVGVGIGEPRRVHDEPDGLVAWVTGRRRGAVRGGPRRRRHGRLAFASLPCVVAQVGIVLLFIGLRLVLRVHAREIHSCWPPGNVTALRLVDPCALAASIS
mmetsp:Transcript_29570/g.89514  ORF Transcript_29570/g.89514 Transcript_29570/m.89514 type:complete len:448 (-) Transcript_29570:250-1593(-)